jgi:hypothetical protein
LSRKSKRKSAAAQPGGTNEGSRSTPRQADDKRSSWQARYRVPGLVLLYILLALNFVRLPKIAVNMTHDLGSHMAFEFYAHAKYQFGVDVIQNIGPYGYLSYPYDYSGILGTQKVLFGILFGLAAAWYALDARRYFSSTAGKAVWFLAIFLALVPRYEELDPLSNLFVLLAGHHLLLGDRGRKGRMVSDTVLCAFLGLFCLMKITEVMLTFLLVMLIAFERVRTRRFVDLACNLGCIGFTVLLLWLAAGQKISNAAEFVRGAMAFSKGYNESLANVGPPEMVWLGLTVLGLFVVVNILRVLKFRMYWHRLPTSLFESACLFLVWKHGYVRSGHEFMFWAFIVQAAALLFMAHEGELAQGGSGKPGSSGGKEKGRGRMNINLRNFAAIPVAIAFVCAALAAVIEHDNQNFAIYAYPWTPVWSVCSRMGANLWDLIDWPGHLRVLKTELEHNRAEAVLSQVKHIVGSSSIDMFGYLPGAILLNDLNYTPRPMPINFGATIPMLMERNAEFYRNDATAPAFLLANIGQIDGRFAPQDDALALLEVLKRYQPVLADHGFVLLKRIPGRPDVERTLIGSQTVTWGESIPVPDTGTNMLWCSADIRFSLAGRVRAFLFHPAQLFIIMTPADRRLGPTRILQSGAGTGFLLRPLIQNSIDFLAAYGLRAEPSTALTPPFDRMGFAIRQEDKAFFEPSFTVSFWTVESKK